MYRGHWGADVIGMTAMPEARLAREAELCYATVAMVTDYDSWHPDHGAVDVAQVIATLGANTEKARTLVDGLSGLLTGDRTACPMLATGRSTTPSSPTPRRAIRRWWRGWMRWQAESFSIRPDIRDHAHTHHREAARVSAPAMSRCGP